MKWKLSYTGWICSSYIYNSTWHQSTSTISSVPLIQHCGWLPLYCMIMSSIHFLHMFKIRHKQVLFGISILGVCTASLAIPGSRRKRAVISKYYPDSFPGSRIKRQTTNTPTQLRSYGAVLRWNKYMWIMVQQFWVSWQNESPRPENGFKMEYSDTFIKSLFCFFWAASSRFGFRVSKVTIWAKIFL